MSERIKILISTEKGGLDDIVFPIFGESKTFTIVEIEEEIKAKVIPNSFAGSGVSIARIAHFALDNGINAVFGEEFSPDIIVLYQAGIEIIKISGIKVIEAVSKYMKREVAPALISEIFPPSHLLIRDCGWWSPISD